MIHELADADGTALGELVRKGQVTPLGLVERVARMSSAYLALSYVCNLTGQPAMSVPLFWNGNNLPIGAQFAGRFGDEGLLIRLASQLEQSRPWRGPRPPIRCSD